MAIKIMCLKKNKKIEKKCVETPKSTWEKCRKKKLKNGFFSEKLKKMTKRFLKIYCTSGLIQQHRLVLVDQ
jgi:hypothetical protein